MKLGDVQKILKAEMVWKANYAELEVSSCHASDLISDLLTYHGLRSVLLTGLTNAQVIRTAEIMDYVAVFFVRGKKPQPEALHLAEEMELPLFVTNMTMYESCGRLYETGLPGASKER